jgi:hypothetical protein
MRLYASILASALAILCALPPISAHAASKPVPGIGVIVKKHPCGNPKCSCHARVTASPMTERECSGLYLDLPADFFGAGSAPLIGNIGLQGRCDFTGTCVTDSGGPGPLDPDHDDDGRLDYREGALPGQFEIVMPAMTLYSLGPIPVDMGGTPDSVGVIVTLSGPGPMPDDPITGGFELVPGTALPVGGASTVQTSQISLHASISFVNATTGALVGGTLEQVLTLALKYPLIPVARPAFGTVDGRIIMGQQASGNVPFAYVSAGGELQLQMTSYDVPMPVSVRSTTWGGLKQRWR